MPVWMQTISWEAEDRKMIRKQNVHGRYLHTGNQTNLLRQETVNLSTENTMTTGSLVKKIETGSLYIFDKYVL